MLVSMTRGAENDHHCVSRGRLHFVCWLEGVPGPVSRGLDLTFRFGGHIVRTQCAGFKRTLVMSLVPFISLGFHPRRWTPVVAGWRLREILYEYVFCWTR